MEGGLKLLLIFIATTTWADDSKMDIKQDDKHNSDLYTFLQNVLNARDDIMRIEKIISDKKIILSPKASTGDKKSFAKSSLRRLRRHSMLKRPGVNAEVFFSSDPEDSDPKSANDDNDNNIVNAIKCSQDYFNEDVSSSALENDSGYDSETLNVKDQTLSHVHNPNKNVDIANAYDIHNNKASEDRIDSHQQIEQKDFDLSKLKSENPESTVNRIQQRMEPDEMILNQTNYVMRLPYTMNEYDIDSDKPKIKGTKINQKRTQTQELPNCLNDRLHMQPQNCESQSSKRFLVMAANSDQLPINSDNLPKKWCSEQYFSDSENDDWKKNVSKGITHDRFEYPNVQNNIKRDHSHEIFPASEEGNSNTPQNYINNGIIPFEQLSHQQNRVQKVNNNDNLYSIPENQELNQSEPKQMLRNEGHQNLIPTNNNKICGNHANIESREKKMIQHKNQLSNYEDVVHKNGNNTIISGLQDSNTMQMVHNRDILLNHEDDLLNDVDIDNIHPLKQETKSNDTAENKDHLSNDSNVKNNVNNSSSNKGFKSNTLIENVDELPKLINVEKNVTSETSESNVNTAIQNEELQNAQICNDKNKKNAKSQDSGNGKLSSNEDQLSNENNNSKDTVDKKSSSNLENPSMKNSKTAKSEDQLLNGKHNFQNNMKDYTDTKNQCIEISNIPHNEDIVVKHQNNLSNTAHCSIDKESKDSKKMQREYQLPNDNNLENNTSINTPITESKENKFIQTEDNLSNKPNIEAFSKKINIHSPNQQFKDGKVMCDQESISKMHSKGNANMENQELKHSNMPQSNDPLSTQLPNVHRSSLRTDSDYQTCQDKVNASNNNPSQKLSIQTGASPNSCSQGPLNMHSNENGARVKGGVQMNNAESYNKCADFTFVNGIYSEKVNPELKNDNHQEHGNEFEYMNNLHPDFDLGTGVQKGGPSYPPNELDELDDESRLKASYIFSTMVSQHPYNINNHHKIGRRDFKEIENIQDTNDKEKSLLELDATGNFGNDQDTQYVASYQNLISSKLNSENNPCENNEKKRNEQKKRKEELASNLKNLIDVNSKLLDRDTYFDNYDETATDSYMREELTPSEESIDQLIKSINHPLRIIRVEGPHTVRQKRTVPCLVDKPHVFHYPVDTDDFNWSINVTKNTVADDTNLGCEIRDLFRKENSNNNQDRSYNNQDHNLYLKRSLAIENKAPDDLRENYVAILRDSSKRMQRLSPSTSEKQTSRCANEPSDTIDIHEFVSNILSSIPSKTNTFSDRVPPTHMRYIRENTENNYYNVFENSDTESHSGVEMKPTNYDTGVKTLNNSQIITSLKAMFPCLVKNGEAMAVREEEEASGHQQSNTNNKYNCNKDIAEDGTFSEDNRSSTGKLYEICRLDEPSMSKRQDEPRKSKSHINKDDNTDNNVSNQPEKCKENNSNNTEDEILTEDEKDCVQDLKNSVYVNTELGGSNIDPKNRGSDLENIADEIDSVGKISLSVEENIKKSKNDKANTKEVVDRKYGDGMEKENHFKGKNKIQIKKLDSDNYYLDNTLSVEKDKIQEEKDIGGKTHNQNIILDEKIKNDKEKNKESDETLENEQNKEDKSTKCNQNCPLITNKDSSFLHKTHQQNSGLMLNEHNKESNNQEHDPTISGETKAKKPVSHDTIVGNDITFPTRIQAEEKGSIDIGNIDFKDDVIDLQSVDHKNGNGMRKNERTISDNENFESVLSSGNADTDQERQIRNSQIRVFMPDFNLETDDVPSVNDFETDTHGNQTGFQSDDDPGTIQDIYLRDLKSEMEESALPIMNNTSNEYINNHVSDDEIKKHQSLFANDVQSNIYKKPSHLFPFKSVTKPTEYDRRSRNVYNNHLQKRTNDKHSQLCIHPCLENGETFPTFESAQVEGCEQQPTEDDKEKDEFEIKEAMSGDLARKIVDSILKKVHKEGTLQKHFVFNEKSRCPDTSDREKSKMKAICNRQKTEETMKSVLSVLQNLAKEEANQKACTKLPPELKCFLQWMLEKSDDELESETEKKNSFLFNKPPVENEPHHSASESEKCNDSPQPNDIIKKIALLQNLIHEYESLSGKDKIQVKTVHDNLLLNLNNLRQLVGLPPLASKAMSSSSTEENKCDTTTSSPKISTTGFTTSAPTSSSSTESCSGIKDEIETQEEVDIVSTKNDEVDSPASDHTLNLLPSPSESGQCFQEPLNIDHIDILAKTERVKSSAVNAPNNDYPIYLKEKPDNLIKTTSKNLVLGDSKSASKTGDSFSNSFNYSISDLTDRNMNSLNYAIDNLGTSNIHGSVNIPDVHSHRHFRSSPVISYSNNTYNNVQASDNWKLDQEDKHGTNEKWDSLRDNGSKFSQQVDKKNSSHHDQSYSTGSLAGSVRHKRLQRDNEYRMHENRHYVRYNPSGNRHQDDDDEYYKIMGQEEGKFPVSAEYEKLVAKATELQQKKRSQRAGNNKKSRNKRKKQSQKNRKRDIIKMIDTEQIF